MIIKGKLPVVLQQGSDLFNHLNYEFIVAGKEEHDLCWVWMLMRFRINDELREMAAIFPQTNLLRVEVCYQHRKAYSINFVHRNAGFSGGLQVQQLHYVIGIDQLLFLLKGNES